MNILLMNSKGNRLSSALVCTVACSHASLWFLYGLCGQMQSSGLSGLLLLGRVGCFGGYCAANRDLRFCRNVHDLDESLFVQVAIIVDLIE
jgi:hypothetical protein